MQMRTQTSRQVLSPVFFDSLFSFVPLFEELSAICMSGTGTMRQNRVQKCPLSDRKTMQKADRGIMDSRSDPDTGVIIVRWSDNSVVTVGSTQFGVFPTGVVSCWSKQDRQQIQVPIPRSILEYNKNMGGTDRMNENIGYYRPGLRIRKW
ncbi:PiggyBac transposable element-derived protein 3-like [Plakobranchus ocellatus]|uniref:PiggyBac transposable element-derived protein 3-like n=1 Tax=Plakobranchus ocellatus TaxID=259542 RepID=A0AAV4AQX7_9GAST|nr:PiggyBac transposable element-derived protein 3-like [Plakobranchus ocellatus]